MDHDRPSHEVHRRKPIFNLVLIGFLAVAAYFLIAEHRAHLSGVMYYLPYLLLLACPVMHLFMHHGHHRHGEHPPKTDDRGEQE